MNKFLAFFTFFFSCWTSSTFAQEDVYITTTTGNVYSVDLNTCTCQYLGNSNPPILWDIATCPNGKTYGVGTLNAFNYGLYEIDVTTGSRTLVNGNITTGTNCLTCDHNNYLYLMLGSNLYRSNNLFLGGSGVFVGNVGALSGGDLAFYNDTLYLATNSNLLQINIDADTISGVSNIGPFGGPPGGSPWGLSSVLSFDNCLFERRMLSAYFTKIYEVNPQTAAWSVVCSNPCNLPPGESITGLTTATEGDPYIPFITAGEDTSLFVCNIPDSLGLIQYLSGAIMGGDWHGSLSGNIESDTLIIDQQSNGQYDIYYFIDSMGCIDSSLVSLTLDSINNNLFNDSLFCHQNTILLSLPLGLGYEYDWSTGDSTNTTQINNSGLYWVDIFYGACHKRDSANIILSPPLNPQIMGPDSACSSDTALFSVSPIGHQYVWSNGDTTDTIFVTGTVDSLIYVTIINTYGCEETDSAVFHNLPAPDISIVFPPGVCEGDSMTINATTSITGAIQWSNGTVSDSITILAHEIPDTIWASIASSIGCRTTDTAYAHMLMIYDNPLAQFDTINTSYPDYIFEFSDESTLQVNSWYWNFGDEDTSTLQNPVHEYGLSGTYTVQLIVSDTNGCKDTLSRIYEIPEFILIPNVISPNHDGQNDVFNIKLSGIIEPELSIYNRWGQLLFKSLDESMIWDGTTSTGNPVPQGTYYYVLTFRGIGGIGTRSGSFALLR